MSDDDDRTMVNTERGWMPLSKAWPKPKPGDPFGLGQMRDNMVAAFNRTMEKVTPEPEEDWTNPDYVLGAVLAQIEDLSPVHKRQVLIEALAAVNDE